MIKIEKIDKYFNRFRPNKIHVINNTSLTFDKTGLVAILGESGSGKSTLLNVIGGLDKVRKGNIYINGQKITKRTQGRVDKIRNLNIGYIFQDYKLIENMSVYDNVSIALKLIGIKDKKEIDKRVNYCLEKVGMLRYKKRPCNMLSGGERQRVGIARAIVKNPNIIIADEPTGNLDSKNSIEIMNIIKAISKDKLVILVSHEKQLVKFYASRILEIEDGRITKDYLNEDESDLDYEIVNNLYLKDYKHKEELAKNITVYSNTKNNIKLNIVVSNNNIYIESLDNRRIEIIDDNSTIQMIDDNYKNISKDDVEKYNFDFKNIIDDKKKLRYSSIFNPITFITNGFKKIFSYSILKKILLVGFFLTGIFIMYSISSIAASLTIKDKDFVNMNKEYLIIDYKKIKLDTYNSLEQNLDINYMFPGNSISTFDIVLDEFYQTSRITAKLEASISSVNMITKKDIYKGRMPETENEVVIDKMSYDKMIKDVIPQNAGLRGVDNIIGKRIKINNMPDLVIVGITNLESPSIYMFESKFQSILYQNKDNEDYEYYDTYYEDIEYSNEYEDYSLYANKITIKEGRNPYYDYEVIVNYNQKDEYKLYKEIEEKINGKKLVVVGYYTSKDNINVHLVNSNMIKTLLIKNSSDIIIYPKNKEETLKKIREEYKLNVKDTYTYSKNKYISKQQEKIKTAVTSSLIILLISLVEIFLMIRASFLSRIKEVGIYRAIGVKKRDIYAMFSGEIIAITLIASAPGILVTAYVLGQMSKVNFLEGLFVMNPILIIISLLLVLTFNLFVGLIPVFNTIKKRPAEILARTDI